MATTVKAKSTKRRKPSSLSSLKKPKLTKSSNSRSGSKKTTDFLSQLQNLREFTSGCGSTFSESDLSQCLRQSGYNVQMAAERLITGQFKASGGSAGSPLSRAYEKSTKEVYSKRSSESSSPSKIGNRKGTIASSSASNEDQKRNLSASSSRNPNLVLPKSKRSNPYQRKNVIKTPAEISNATQVKPLRKGQGMLLCQRWICGLSTSRRGSMSYQESVEIRASGAATSTSKRNSNSNNTAKNSIKALKLAKGANIVRFKASKVEGTLDSKISSFLAPLLRGNTTSRGPLISVLAKGLMEDLRLDIGMEVPLELEVYITKPFDFFALFESDDGVLNKKNDKHSEFLRAQSGSAQSPMAQAAFDLLQWAHYSSLPKFDSNSNLNEGGDDGSDAEDDEEQNLDSNNGGGEHGNIEEEAPDWAEDLFCTMASSPAGQKEDKESDKVIEEETDPIMLNKKGIHLRCYQRQALSWMMRREENANEKGSDEFQKQMELLSELAASHRSTSDGSGGSGRRSINNLNAGNQSVGVKCAVGPVLVSEEVASKSRSLDGVRDPVLHPLWQRRFLWEKDSSDTSSAKLKEKGELGSGVYSFYVNELLSCASKSAPSPPKECCGGILADSMGLGKTVMLLSLIAKDKERDCLESNSIPDGDNQAVAKPFELNCTRKSEVIEIDLESDNDEDSESEREDEKECRKRRGNEKDYFHKTTLVVAPLSLLSQWEEEIQTKSSLSCLAYYGDQAKKFSKSEISGVDVLITTYGMLQSEYSSKNQIARSTSLLSTCFRRAILDEAHYIKNPKTTVSKACCEIKAERRWCVTGTPISNSLQDVYGLLKFLKHEPWCVDRFWKKAIRIERPTGNQDEVQSQEFSTGQGEDETSLSLGRVRRMLKPLLLRRTKDSLTQNGNPILVLPPIEARIISVTLSDKERYFYNVLLSKSQNVFDGYIKSGNASKSWFAIFALLQRLRQACDHLALTVKSRLVEEDTDKPNIFSDENKSNDKDDGSNTQPERDNVERSNEKFLRELLDSVQSKKGFEDVSCPSEQNTAPQTYSQKVVESLTQCIQSDGKLNEECAICLEVPSISDIAVTPCTHVFCRPCLLSALNRNTSKQSQTGECPICSTEVSQEDVIFTQADLPNVDSKEIEVQSDPCKAENLFDAREILESAIKGKRSSKMISIVRELNSIWTEDPHSKVLIFSQYLGMFDLLQKEFKREGISFFRLDGKMSLNERRRTLKLFNSKIITTASRKDGDRNELKRGTVLLASMKACGVGMNLTAASSVFILDPWWNHALESQCINRIHRIGQTAEVVRVRKFIVSDSVEEKIVKMQEQKKGMASEVLSDQTSVARSKNPTLDDLKAIFGR